MGSGKSYEAIKTAILLALKSGRRIVTNISGINENVCLDYLVKKGSDSSKLGSIVSVSNERVSEPNFFPGEIATEFKFEILDWIPLKELHYYAQHFALSQGKNFTKTNYQLIVPSLVKLKNAGFDIGSCLVEAATKEWKSIEFDYFDGRPRNSVFAEIPDSGPSVVQPGDLVVIDEAWRYWADSTKLTPEHMNFFRMHRHYTRADGVACDLLILIQDFASLHRFLRGVCELVLVFTKMKSLGFMSRYRVETYEGRPSRKTLVSRSTLQKYDKDIFPMYKSYDGVKGSESVIDDRQNLFKNKWFVGVMFFAFCGLIAAGYWFFNYVQNMKNGGSPSKPQLNSSISQNHQPSTLAVQPNQPTISPSAEARLVGVFQHDSGESTVIFQLPDGRLVRQRMDSGVIDGWQSVAGYQGRLASFSFQPRSKQ